MKRKGKFMSYMTSTNSCCSTSGERGDKMIMVIIGERASRAGPDRRLFFLDLGRAMFTKGSV